MTLSVRVFGWEVFAVSFGGAEAEEGGYLTDATSAPAGFVPPILLPVREPFHDYEP